MMLSVMFALLASVAGWAGSAVALPSATLAATSRRLAAAAPQPADRYLQLAQSGGLFPPTSTATDHQGLIGGLGHAPSPEAEPANTPSPPTSPAAVPEVEEVPTPQPAAEGGDQGEGSLGSQLGAAASGVGQGIAGAAKSFAGGAEAVGDTVGNAVGDALGSVAGWFKGRRLQQLQQAQQPPASSAALTTTPTSQAPAAELAAVQASSLSSPLPFYALLLEPALDPYLAAAAAADPQRRQQLLLSLAGQLVGVVEGVLNDTEAQLEALLADVEAMVPAGATPAEVAAIESDPSFWSTIGGPLNQTTTELASVLSGAAEEAARPVYDSLTSSGSQLAPFPAFYADFISNFVLGLARGILAAVYGTALEGPVLPVPAGGSRRSLLQSGPAAAGQGQQPAGQQGSSGLIQGTVVNCSPLKAGNAPDCRGYQLQGSSPGQVAAYPVPAPQAEATASELTEEAALIGGAALQAGVLVGSGALQAAASLLQSSSAQLGAGLGRRRRLLQATAGPAPEVEERTSDITSAAQQVQDAISKGTQEASQGIGTATSATNTAIGGAATVLTGAAQGANQLALGAAQAAAQVAAAVNSLIQTGKAVGQAAGQAG